MRRLILFLVASACSEAPQQAPTITTIAGVYGTAGFNGGGHAALEAWLYDPEDVVVAPDGGLLIADDNNHAIRRLTPGGIVDVVAGGVFIGDGPDGPALTSSFNHPASLTLDPDDPGVLWIAATGNHRIKLLDLAEAHVEAAVGSGVSGFAGDGGDAGQAEMGRPTSVAFGPDGDMYVSDKLNHVIRRVDADGVITTFAGQPGARGYKGDGGPASEARLRAQQHGKYDPSSRITVAGHTMYVVDTGNQVLRAIDLDTQIITTLAGSGDAGNGSDGAARSVDLLNPHDVAVGPDGTVFLSDTGNHCVRALLADDTLVTVAGVCGASGFAGDGVDPRMALLNYPSGIDVGPDGTLFIADTYNHVIRRVDHPLGHFEAAP